MCDAQRALGLGEFNVPGLDKRIRVNKILIALEHHQTSEQRPFRNAKLLEDTPFIRIPVGRMKVGIAQLAACTLEPANGICQRHVGRALTFELTRAWRLAQPAGARRVQRRVRPRARGRPLQCCARQDQ